MIKMDYNVCALSEEVNRLKDELNAATLQRCQAAEQGLILLAQKEQLQQQLDEAEGRLDCFRQELEQSRKALNDLNSATRRQSRVDFEDEQDLLTLSVTREMEMSQQIHDLEVELKNLRSAYDNLVAENDKISASLAHLQTTLRQSELNRKDLRSELAQMKLKETQSLADYADLEEENISLQKQLLHMKQAQVEFEALKHEMKRYQEETDILNAQLDEMTRLRTMAQRSLGETLEALQIEREKVHSMQRELDYRSVSVFRQPVVVKEQTSAAIIRGVLDSGLDEEDESGCFSEAQNDLLSEIQSTEQRKFESAVSCLETEKADLRRQLEDSQTSLQVARREIHLKKEEIEALQSQIDVIMSIENETVEEPESVDAGEEERLRRAVKSQEHKYVIALKQISSLQQELRRCHELEQLGRQFGGEDELRQEVVRLRGRLAQRDNAIHTLESDLVLVNAMASRTSANLTTVHTDLQSAANELMRIYIRAGNACGQKVPAKYVVEHLAHCRLHFTDDGHPIIPPQEDAAKEGQDLNDIGRMSEALFYLVKHTSTAVVGMSQQLGQNGGEQTFGSQMYGQAKDSAELQQQITRLKSMLCNKREQVATLRNVLRANKKTAEEALANLKTRYEHEKSRASETMSKLRSELKAHREEAATFTSLRALYAQKCDEYVTQLDELQRRHQMASDERNTFRSLLSMSLSQKADLSKRVEELEKVLATPITSGKSKRRQNGAD